MKYLWNSFISTLALRLRGVTRWLPLLLLPLLILAAVHLIPTEEASAPVTVGVALPEEGGEAFWARLEQRSGTVLTFVLSDSDTIDQNVATGRWDCGLVLAEDFEEMLEELDTDRLFTLRIGSGSTVYPLVRETVFACVAELLSPAVAKEFLAENGISGRNAARLEEILPEEERVQISMVTAGGDPLETMDLADESVTAILRWLISAVLLVWLLLSAADLGRWLDSPAARRLRPLRAATALLLPRMAGDGLLALCSGCGALLLLGDGIGGCLAALTYLLFLGTLSLLLAHFRPLWTALPILMPFMPVVCLVLSPAVVDLSLLSPALSGVIRWQPVTLFLRGCGGDGFALLLLSGMAILLLLLSLLTDRIRTKHAAG